MSENRYNAKKCIFCGKTIVGKRKLICSACLQKGCNRVVDTLVWGVGVAGAVLVEGFMGKKFTKKH